MLWGPQRSVVAKTAECFGSTFTSGFADRVFWSPPWRAAAALNATLIAAVANSKLRSGMSCTDFGWQAMCRSPIESCHRVILRTTGTSIEGEPR